MLFFDDIESTLMCVSLFFFFFFKQKTAYEMRISDWSSDVCSSDLRLVADLLLLVGQRLELGHHRGEDVGVAQQLDEGPGRGARGGVVPGEHNRDENAGAAVCPEGRLAVVALDRHEYATQVACVLRHGLRSPAHRPPHTYTTAHAAARPRR